MKLNVYCPVCGGLVKKNQIFTPMGADRDFVCNKCSSAFYLDLHTHGPIKNKSKINQGLVMALGVQLDKSYELLNINKPSPPMHCVLHEGRKSLGEPNEDLMSGLCPDCGAQYALEFLRETTLDLTPVAEAVK